MNTNTTFWEPVDSLIKKLRDRPKYSLYRNDMQLMITTTIKEYRIEKELSQKMFAEFMGVTQGMVSRWESGEYNFTIDNIAKICDKLKISPLSIFSTEKYEYLFKEAADLETGDWRVDTPEAFNNIAPLLCA